MKTRKQVAKTIKPRRRRRRRKEKKEAPQKEEEEEKTKKKRKKKTSITKNKQTQHVFLRAKETNKEHDLN